MSITHWMPLVALAACVSAEATTIGPDSFGYTATTSVAYQFQDIRATGTVVLAGVGDQAFAAAIGFTFNLYGTGYTTAYLSSNGLVSLGGVNTRFTNENPTTTQVGGGPVFASHWDDLIPNGDATDTDRGVHDQTIGKAGNRTFIVREVAHSFFTGGSSIDFETVFSEANGSILVRDNATTFGNAGFDQGASATVGSQGDLSLGQVAQYEYEYEYEYNTAGSVLDNASICFSVGGFACGAPLVTPPSGVPEPESLALLGIGMIGAFAARRRRA